MRTLSLAVLPLLASIAIAGCSGGGSASSSTPNGGANAIVSCNWGNGLCDQYAGTIDPTFATNLATTCGMYGVAYATAACPSTNQVAGHCALSNANGATSSLYYYSPTYDATTAQADCLSAVVGVTWVP
jgi:hypothetical protein